MKNLFSYKNFVNEKFNAINEAKANPISLFKKDLKGLLDDMFAKVKKPEYEYDSEGFPTKVEFEIVENDFKVEYDKIKTEFSEGVLKKRTVLPVLIFDEKEEEKKGDTSTYKISFKIQKEDVKIEKKPRKEQFERDSDDQLLAKLKSKKVSVPNKEKIIDILKARGVKYKDPFDNDADDELSEEEMEKKAAKAAAKKDKKNESVETNESFHMPDGTPIPVDSNHMPIVEDVKKEDETCECDKPKCDCGQDPEKEEDINEGFLGKIAKVLSKKEYEKTLNHCLTTCCEDNVCCDKSDIEDCLKDMVFSKITKKALNDDTKMFKSLVDEIYKDCKKKCDEKVNESILKFGSDEWNKKYGIIIEKEEQEVCLDCLVNETLKNKNIEYESLNEKINNTIEYNEIKPLETKKK